MVYETIFVEHKKDLIINVTAQDSHYLCFILKDYIGVTSVALQVIWSNKGFP